MKDINYTIIIPHKNTPKLLQRCLNSIPRRDDVQIVIIDDNSDSEKVNFSHFPGVGEKCVEAYFTKEGKGAGYARNVGLKYAKGKWLLFADADDYYFEGAFDTLDREMNDDLDVLYFNVSSNVIKKGSRGESLSMLYSAYKNSLDESIIKYGFWAPWNKVVSFDFIKRNALLFDEIPVGNDAMFCLKASYLSRRIKIIHNKLYCLVDNEGSITFQEDCFERICSYTLIRIEINTFLQQIKQDGYKTIVITPRSCMLVLCRDGMGKLFALLRVISKEYGLLKLAKDWISYKKVI